uniref:Uncharacterized protein n=1 Tax=Oryza nivara TaxID=4536 RepID=A0A0E0GQF8_ORYNI
MFLGDEHDESHGQNRFGGQELTATRSSGPKFTANKSNLSMPLGGGGKADEDMVQY